MRIARPVGIVDAQGEPSEIHADLLAPRLDWTDADGADHVVQFYESESFLVRGVADFMAVALAAGDAAVAVARSSFRRALERRLVAQGFDLPGARATGRYVCLDAERMLSAFMVDGMPEPRRFTKAVGAVLDRAAEGGRRVRVFGEMVAVLWAQGNHDAAIRLEQMWNTLRATRPFLLYCAYPASNLAGAAHTRPLAHVCAAHSLVVPAESYTALDNHRTRLRAIAMLQQKARSLEAEIAERRRAEAALRATQRELERQIEERGQLLAREQVARAEAENANRMKDEFLATVSHELRTPLNAIIGWAHLLSLGRLDDATAARAVETIERNATSQARLVEDLLDTSRIIMGQMRLSVGPVDLALVIDAAIDSVRPAAEAKGIHLDVDLDASARHISGDAGRLQQVVWNLLSNAIKFTPAGGSVGVRLERAARDVELSVSDTGEGIPPEVLPFVFDRFRQADGSTTRRHGGLGLGLAIVRHLVELHGGTIRAESAGGGAGARFAIRLRETPAASPATPGAAATALTLVPKPPAAEAIGSATRR